VKIRELKAGNTSGNYWVDIVWVSKMMRNTEFRIHTEDGFNGADTA
jgi:hypothetical protein